MKLSKIRKISDVVTKSGKYFTYSLTSQDLIVNKGKAVYWAFIRDNEHLLPKQLEKLSEKLKFVTIQDMIENFQKKNPRVKKIILTFTKGDNIDTFCPL